MHVRCDGSVLLGARNSPVRSVSMLDSSGRLDERFALGGVVRWRTWDRPL